MSGAGYILGVDIGNTNTVFGLFDADGQGEVRSHWRTVTRLERTSDELGIFLLGFLQSGQHDPARVGGFIYSSVVPNFNPIVARMARDYFHCEPYSVTHENVPLTFSYPRPFEIGADRLVNAVAAARLYGGDSIVVDLGTATTFCVLHGNDYLGGAIAPGLKLSMDTLSRKTAQLPPIEFARPPCGVIGDSTIHALQSGFFFGWVGLLRGIIEEVRATQPKRSYRVIGTGGLSALIHREVPEVFDVVDPMLTLRGLQILFRDLAGR